MAMPFVSRSLSHFGRRGGVRVGVPGGGVEYSKQPDTRTATASGNARALTMESPSYDILGRGLWRRSVGSVRHRGSVLRAILRSLWTARPSALGTPGADSGRHDGARLFAPALPADRP